MNWFKNWVKIGQRLDAHLSHAELDAVVAELTVALKVSRNPVDVRIDTYIDEQLDDDAA